MTNLKRELIQIVEMEVDRCVLSYGEDPCTAALGVTGVRKCYNTFRTCQDTPNFTPSLEPDMVLAPLNEDYFVPAGRTDFDGITGDAFTRSTTATYTDATGTLQTAAIDEARVNHHVFDGTNFVRAGMLVEEAATNLVLYSEDLTQFAASGVSVSGQVVTEDTSTGLHRIQTSTLTMQTTPHTIWVDVDKTSERRVFLNASALLGAGSLFDVSDSSPSVVATSGAGFVDAGFVDHGDFYRLWMVGDSGVANNAIYVQMCEPGHTSASDDSYTGNGTSSITVGRLQYEAGNIPGGSSYIPTTGATVARAADDLRIPAAVMAKAMADKVISGGLDGAFSEDGTSLDGWLPGQGSATVTLDGGTFRVAAGSGGTSSVAKSFVTVIGTTYALSGKLTASSGFGWLIKSDAQNSWNLNRVNAFNQEAAPFEDTATFVATATTTWIHLLAGTLNTDVSNYDDLVVATMPTALGPELVTNGVAWTGAAGSTPPTGWTDSGGTSLFTITGGALRMQRNNGAGQLQQTITDLVIGITYTFSLDVVAVAAGIARIQMLDIAGTPVAERATAGPLHITFVATATSHQITFQPANSLIGDVTIDNASVREVKQAISIAAKGRMTYADEDIVAQSTWMDWRVDGDNYISGSLQTNSTRIGRAAFTQKALGANFATSTSASDAYAPGNNVPFSIASRHGATFINGAHEGTLLTADLTPTALADLVTADFEIASVGNFIIEQVLIWFVDIGDDGITEATTL